MSYLILLPRLHQIIRVQISYLLCRHPFVIARACLLAARRTRWICAAATRKLPSLYTTLLELRVSFRPNTRIVIFV